VRPAMAALQAAQHEIDRQVDLEGEKSA
jgi:hypothetical protein